MNSGSINTTSCFISVENAGQSVISWSTPGYTDTTNYYPSTGGYYYR